MNIKQISVLEHIEQLRPLIAAHGQEVYGVEVCPMLERYCQESVIVLAMFDEETIVGYVSTFVLQHGHIADLVAIIDAIYLLPEYRRGRNGLFLLEAAERCAKEMGAKTAIISAKPKSALAKILNRRYYVDEICYAREL